MLRFIFSFFRFLFCKNSEEKQCGGLWTASFGEIGASLSVLEKNGFTLDMLKQLRGEGGGTVAKKIVALFMTDHHEIKSSWQTFYKKYFDINIDLSSVKIPVPKLGFTRCIIIIPGITPNMVVKAMRDQFKVWTYVDDLDKTIVKNDREAKDGPYAIWVKDGLEPEKDYRNVSADGLAKKNICGETLLERLIHGFEYWGKTKKHLDYKDITLCSGSRDSGGEVPGVYFGPSNGKVKVRWFSADYSSDDLGVREVSF